MRFRTILAWAFCFLLSAAMAMAAEPKLTFYAPFDGSIDAKVAGGHAKGRFLGKTGQPAYADGIRGKGFLAGLESEQLRYDAKGNISPDAWTVTFWVKGLKGADWNSSSQFQMFWGLAGDQGEILWFYKYNKNKPWLFYRPKKGQGNARYMYLPLAPEEQWHYWAVSWHKGTGAYVYLDGELAGQSPCVSPDPVDYIYIGGSHADNQNKIIDEFKIYDAAMSGAQIARQYYKEGNVALNPTLTVTPTKHKITIDGKIEPGEWGQAAGFAGLIDQKQWTIEPPATWGKITYDDQNLYVLMHSAQPAKVKASPDMTALHGLVKKDAVKHDDPAVLNDDLLGIGVQPDAKGSLYGVLVNGVDTVTDLTVSGDGQPDFGWESHAKIKSTVDMDGWTLEAAIPLKSLGVDQVTDAMAWRAVFGRSWKMLLQRTDLWAVGTRGLDQKPEAPTGTLRFAGPAQPTADLRTFEFSDAAQVRAEVNLHNPDSKTHELSIILSAGDAPLEQKKIALKADESSNVKFDVTPKDAAGKLISIDVREGKQVILRQSAPFIPQQVGQLAMWSYPSKQQLRVGWTIVSAPEARALSLTADLKDASGKRVAQTQVDSLPALHGSAMMDIQSIPAGQYVMDIQVKSKEEVVQHKTISFEKRPTPKWLGNTLGISDTPPSPWTDVKVDRAKDAVDIWGRTYDYAGRLLPKQIVNQGKEMLTGPMRLVVKTSDPSSSENKADSAKWTQATAVKAQSLRTRKIGSVELRTDTSIEYDGMAWMDLTASPASGGAELNELTLEIPLKAEWARLFRPAFDYRLKHTGPMPEKGWKGKAMEMPWVGNGDGGIQFFQESVAHWIGSKSIEITPNENGVVTMRIHLVDVKTKLDQPLKLSLGWIVSPVKASPKYQRDWRAINTGDIRNPQSPVGAYLVAAKQRNPNLKPFFPWWQGWWWMPPHSQDIRISAAAPIPVPKENVDPAFTEYHGIKIFGAPYGRMTEMGTANPWFEQFGDEWVPTTDKFVSNDTAPAATRIGNVSQAARSLRDFYVWGYGRMIDQGQAKGMYFDVSRPINDTNIHHGAGVEMPDGSIAPQLNILGTRKTFQRLYTLLKQKHPDGLLLYHMSGETMLPIDSFCDAMIDGENYAGLLDRKDNRGYEHVLSLDQFRIEYSAQNNFGPATLFLPEFDRSGAIKKDEWKSLGYGHAQYLLGLVLAHDSSIWWAYFPREVLARAYGALDEAGLNSQWTFIPYWRQQAFKLPKGVVASLYLSPDRSKAVVVVMNVSGEDRTVDLSIDGGTLKGRSIGQVKNLYPEGPATAENGEVRGLQVKQNNFRAILLTW